MSTFITLQQAKDHLRLTDTGDSPSAEDADLQLKLDQAEAIILDRLGGDDDWTVDTVPLAVQAAILEQLGELWRFRGDDTAQDLPKRDHGYLAPTIESKLHRHRDPPLA